MQVPVQQPAQARPLPQVAREIAAGIPDAKLEIIPDCGHLSTMEQPVAVNRALRAWLTG